MRSSAAGGRAVCTQGTFWGCWNLKQLAAPASLAVLASCLPLHRIHLPPCCRVCATPAALSRVGCVALPSSPCCSVPARGAAHPRQAPGARSERQCHGTAFCISNTIAANAQLSLPEEPMEKEIDSFPLYINTFAHISVLEIHQFSTAVRPSQARLSKANVEEASKSSSSSWKPGCSIYSTCLEIWVNTLRFCAFFNQNHHIFPDFGVFFILSPESR